MSNETIFREVDDELRGDRMRKLWKRFGPYLIGAAIAVVLVVAANEGWSWLQATTAARSSDQFYAALEQAENGDAAGAQQALQQVVAEGSGGYPTLARFRAASLLGVEGKRDEAVAAYDAIATQETNPRLRELALVLSAYILADAGDVSAVLQRVGGLVTPENPMRNAAREAIGLTQYKAGDLDPALATFRDVLDDPMAGQEIRQRVQIYVAQLIALGATGPEEQAAAAAAAEAAAETGTAPAEEPVADVPAEATPAEAVPAEAAGSTEQTEPVPEIPPPPQADAGAE